MTSLEERRRLLAEAGTCLYKLQHSNSTRDLLPVLVSMMNFMQTMLEEDEAMALVNLLKRNGMSNERY